MLHPSIKITHASVVSGSARGRSIGVPTLNIALSSAPEELTSGIYACLILFDGKTYKGAMHFGPRPVFRDTETFEIHVLDAVIDAPPTTVDLEIIARIRDIENFPNVEALKKAIEGDISSTRAILDKYENTPETALS